MVDGKEVLHELCPKRETGKISHDLRNGRDPALPLGHSHLSDILGEIKSKLDLEAVWFYVLGLLVLCGSQAVVDLLGDILTDRKDLGLYLI